MSKIIQSFIAFIIAIIGLVGGLIWAFKSNWEPEPIILLAISSLELIGYAFLKNYPEQPSHPLPFVQSTNINSVSLTINPEKDTQNQEINDKQKALTRILFVDDNHTEFKMVSILKKAGWINTKSTKDVTDLDDPKVVEADIIFVDINGVGVALFEDQGLGLASALKKKYLTKKIVIYSAENTGDRFHKALREVDNCLSKNAEPYQFINLIDSFYKMN